MILEEIRLQDFRCFYGDTRIRLSAAPEKNVTIIYAENGVGKTTLLNALIWCFYGETTARFELREAIINYDAQKNGTRTASVAVVFEHNDQRYIAKRYFSTSPSARRSFVVARLEDGSRVDLPSPDTFINTVIPREMASHFLFDGEHAEAFLGENNRTSIKSAVRDILGCSMIQTAIEDLQAVAKLFRKQIPSTPANKQMTVLNDRLDKLTLQNEAAEAELVQLKEERTQTLQQIEHINTKLRDTAAAQELQRGRDRLDALLRRAQKRQKEFADDAYRWLGDNGRFAVSRRITEETFGFLDAKEHRGRIPSPYNEEFVKDILEAEQCICGAQLAPGSAESRKVASLLQRAANQVMRDRISKVRARLTSLKSERVKTPGRLAKAKKHLADVTDECATIEAQLGELSEKLKGINLEDIGKRERRRSELLDVVRKVERTIGAVTMRVESYAKESQRIAKELDALARLDVRTAIYSRRRQLCEEIRDKFTHQLLVEEKQARRVVRAGIERVLQATIRKVLHLRMTDDYEISLVNADGTVLPKSSGENQLLGLAFTAALIEFAQLRKSAQDYRLLPGTIAPLVLDSPFGQLDETYRATTAEFIPQMARQVVLLVSQSQGSEEVLAALRQHLGAEYLLVRHNREPRDTRRVEQRELKGKAYDTTVFDSSYDGTEIVEVTGL